MSFAEDSADVDETAVREFAEAFRSEHDAARCGLCATVYPRGDTYPSRAAIAAGLAFDRHRQSPGGDSHYRQGGIEPADFILSNELPGWKAIALEYLFRSGRKPGVSDTLDLEKCRWWIDKRLTYLREKEEAAQVQAAQADGATDSSAR